MAVFYNDWIFIFNFSFSGYNLCRRKISHRQQQCRFSLACHLYDFDQKMHRAAGFWTTIYRHKVPYIHLVASRCIPLLAIAFNDRVNLHNIHLLGANIEYLVQDWLQEALGSVIAVNTTPQVDSRWKPRRLRKFCTWKMKILKVKRQVLEPQHQCPSLLGGEHEQKLHLVMGLKQQRHASYAYENLYADSMREQFLEAKQVVKLVTNENAYSYFQDICFCDQTGIQEA